jgi:uncharacterized membrane protein
MKERFKSPVVWAAVLSQICIIIALYAPDISDEFKTVAACIIEILTLFGILNNPADKDNF